MAKELVLASGSESRKEIMNRLGFKYTIDVSDYDEDMTLNLKPVDLAIHLSKGKAETVARRHKNAVILAADSFALLDGELLGKPHTKKKAKEMLRQLSGKCHTFITGFTIIDTASGKEYSGSEDTKVYFRKLTDKEIDNYISKEYILNKAGAYKIWGLGEALVEKIEGTSSNASGLPMAKVTVALRKFGVDSL